VESTLGGASDSDADVMIASVSVARVWPADTATGGVNLESILDETTSCTDFIEERAT
jgi:hypothetical protein